MSREILTALAAGLASAVLYLSMRTGTPGALLLAYLSSFPLLFAGLSAGWVWSVVAGITALAGIAAGASALMALLFGLMMVVPAVLIARQGTLSRPGTAPGVVEWYPSGLLLSWLTGYALAGLAGVAFALSGQDGGMVGVTGRYLESALRLMAPEQAGTEFGTVVTAAARYLPGMMGAVWIAVIVANAALAQALLVRLGWNRRPSPAYSAVEVPRALLAPLAFCAVLSLMSGQLGAVGLNGMIIAAMPFMFQGLAVAHALLRGRVGRGPILAVVYLSIVLMSWPAILFVGLGIIEQWVQLRRRHAGPPDDQEEE